VRFGCFVPQGWRLDLVGIDDADQWEAIVDVARAIEAAGYESLWVYDHFHTVPQPTQEATYEAWTLMAALAAATDTVRLGQMCTSIGYRSPAYLAKVAATIDVISGGRLELGIGAGWYEHEYDGYGYEFPSAGTRIAQLREGVEVIKRMWTEDVVEHHGEHFDLAHAICRPKPLQEPHVPVWVAGGGERKTLRVAAEHADHTNFAGDLETFTHKSEVLRGHCEDLGTDFERIVRSANYNVVCEETEADGEERIAENRARWVPLVGEDAADRMADQFRKLGVTPEQQLERLGAVGEAGMSYAILYFAEAAYDTSGLERFMREVAPELA
jgi:F420-dependent oxidoreductase-like protein